MWCVEHAPITLSIKFKKKHEKYQNIPHDHDNNIKYSYESIKIPSILRLYFVSYKIKDVIAMYIKI
jgi:hypothetical protein